MDIDRIEAELKALKIVKPIWDSELKDIVERPVSPHVFRNERDTICISAEHGDGMADYYGEGRGGYPWIDPELEKFAEERNMFWEWRDPGSIALYDI